MAWRGLRPTAASMPSNVGSYFRNKRMDVVERKTGDQTWDSDMN